MRRRVKGAVLRRILGALSDEALLMELTRRFRHPGASDTGLLAQLVARMRARDAGELIELLTTVRPMDYSRHRIELVVGSPAIALRLRSVEKEPFTVEWIERSIKPGTVFYDIGANVGAYSLIAAKLTGNGARIFAFEPSAATFHDLVRNIIHNGCGASIVPLPLALWSETALLSFELRSQLAGAARHRINPEPGLDAPLAQTILGVRLDDLVDRPGLPVPTHAKIDVDGYELDVLRGAERTLRRVEWRSVIIELDPEESERNRAIKALLADAGLTDGERHERTASRRYPRPDERPDVYWTFAREAALSS